MRTAGLYVITATLEWAADPIGWRTAFLRVSDDGNAAYDQRPPVKGAETIQAITALQAMAAGAYVELIVRQNSGSTLALGGGVCVQTSVSAAWLAP